MVFLSCALSLPVFSKFSISSTWEYQSEKIGKVHLEKTGIHVTYRNRNYVKVALKIKNQENNIHSSLAYHPCAVHCEERTRGFSSTSRNASSPPTRVSYIDSDAALSNCACDTAAIIRSLQHNVRRKNTFSKWVLNDFTIKTSSART